MRLLDDWAEVGAVRLVTAHVVAKAANVSLI